LHQAKNRHRRKAVGQRAAAQFAIGIRIRRRQRDRQRRRQRRERAEPDARGSPPYDRQTAVYDISAKTVYLPDGTKLEAHSGLGDKMDDVRSAQVRMRA